MADSIDSALIIEILTKYLGSDQAKAAIADLEAVSAKTKAASTASAEASAASASADTAAAQAAEKRIAEGNRMAAAFWAQVEAQDATAKSAQLLTISNEKDYLLIQARANALAKDIILRKAQGLEYTAQTAALERLDAVLSTESALRIRETLETKAAASAKLEDAAAADVNAAANDRAAFASRKIVSIFDELARGQRGAMMGTIGSIFKEMGGGLLATAAGMVALMGAFEIFHVISSRIREAKEELQKFNDLKVDVPGLISPLNDLWQTLIKTDTELKQNRQHIVDLITEHDGLRKSVETTIDAINRQAVVSEQTGSDEIDLLTARVNLMKEIGAISDEQAGKIEAAATLRKDQLKMQTDNARDLAQLNALLQGVQTAGANLPVSEASNVEPLIREQQAAKAALDNATKQNQDNEKAINEALGGKTGQVAQAREFVDKLFYQMTHGVFGESMGTSGIANLQSAIQKALPQMEHIATTIARQGGQFQSIRFGEQASNIPGLTTAEQTAITSAHSKLFEYAQAQDKLRLLLEQENNLMAQRQKFRDAVAKATQAYEDISKQVDVAKAAQDNLASAQKELAEKFLAQATQFFGTGPEARASINQMLFKGAAPDIQQYVMALFDQLYGNAPSSPGEQARRQLQLTDEQKKFITDQATKDLQGGQPADVVNQTFNAIASLRDALQKAGMGGMSADQIEAAGKAAETHRLNLKPGEHITAREQTQIDVYEQMLKEQQQVAVMREVLSAVGQNADAVVTVMGQIVAAHTTEAENNRRLLPIIQKLQTDLNNYRLQLDHMAMGSGQ